MSWDHPSALRNREPIARVLERVLPQSGDVLEIASGTGTHALFYAQSIPRLSWQPSEVDPELVSIMDTRIAQCGLPNLRAPRRIDVTEDDWGIDSADVALCANMIHISPWTCAEGLFRGSDRILSAQGVLFVYGPFFIEGRPTAPSNEQFDQSLRSRNPAWGIRWLRELEKLAAASNLGLDEIVDMPANNFSLVFRRSKQS